MKFYNQDSHQNKDDVSLCKIKVKPHRQDRYSEDDDVNEYVIESKRRTVFLQFESPMQRKRSNSRNRRASRGRNSETDPTPFGAVRGIKNLSTKHEHAVHRLGKNLIQKKKNGLGLEGIYIEFDKHNTLQPGRLQDGSFDKGKPSTDLLKVDYEDGDELYDEDAVEENNFVKLESDDNYYKKFLQSVQCRVSVKQIKCNDENDYNCDDANFYNEAKMKMKNIQCVDDDENLIARNRYNGNSPDETLLQDNGRDIVVAWSGEHQQDQRSRAPSEIFDQTNLISTEDDKLDFGSIENSFNDNNNIARVNDDARKDPQKGNSWMMQTLIGSMMSLNACGGINDTKKCKNADGDENNKFDSNHQEMQQFNFFEEDYLSEKSLDPPTALYAAIGAKNWNVALRRLVEAPEEAEMWVSSGTSDDGTVIEFLPLHLSLISEAPLMLVTLLVQAYPEATREFALEKLPIHMGVENQVDHRIIFLLLNQYPESLEVQDDEGNTPIELASLTEATEERNMIVEVLTRKMENTVVTEPTALYDSIDCQNWNYAVRRVVEVPQESTIWVSFRGERFLPLHVACFMGAPYLLVSDLIEAYPDAIRKKTLKGKLPLHLGCSSLVDERIIRLLIELYPEGLKVKDVEGMTALEVTKSLDPCPERSNIIEILETEMEGSDEKLVFTPTKLYSYVQEKNWDDAVRRVLEAPDEASIWVGANRKSGDVKCLPLHIACALRAPLMLVAVLVRSYPDSVKKKTKSGKLPLHISCEKRCSERVVSFLLHSWPDSYHVKDHKGQTCMQTALLSKTSEQRTKNVETLVEFENKDATPPVTPDVQRNGSDQSEYSEFRDDVYREEGNQMHAIDMKSSGKMKKKKFKKVKNVLFKRKQSKSLWEKDEIMFADE